jgi:hypothetical protein
MAGAYKKLSTFFSEEKGRKSVVLKSIETGKYHVSCMSDTGSSFTTIFDSIDDAENFAEDWVVL